MFHIIYIRLGKKKTLEEFVTVFYSVLLIYFTGGGE